MNDRVGGAWCRDKLGDYQQKLGKNRPLRKDNKTESECNGKEIKNIIDIL